MRAPLVVLAFLVNTFLAFIQAQQTDGYDVSQIHIAQGKTPESMYISWVTKGPSDSVVVYGNSADNMDNKASGEIVKYNFDYPTWGMYESGVIHHVLVENLIPGTTYFYRCGDFSLGYTSGVESFTTMPAVGNLNEFSFGVIGDLGQTTDTASTLNHVTSNPTLGLILHAGDLSYADCNQKLWDSYGILIEDLAKGRPWMVGPGNHEIEVNTDGSQFVSFEARYRMPAVKPAEFGAVTIPSTINSATGLPWCASSVFQQEYNWGNSFYSFEVASAHVIFLNPYSVSNETSVQYQWLIEDLNSIDRQKTPWVIVVMHCPWYNSDSWHVNEQQAVLMKASMEPVFYKYKVNFVIVGHVHAYERTYPVFNDVPVEDGVVYVTIGDGGNAEGHANGFANPPPAWSAYTNGTQYGHGELILKNKDQMVWKWHRNVDGEKVTKDEVTICNTQSNAKAYCV